MQLIDGRPVYAATDLVGYLACAHRFALERAAMHGLVAKPMRNDPTIELVARRGLEHERRYLADLHTEGRRVVEITRDGSRIAPLTDASAPVPWDAGAELRAAADETLAAMRDGADVIYQGTFFDGTWRGHADFLLRVEHAPGEPDSAFGAWHYEVADTKLARHVKASAILQICSYVDLLTAIQVRRPALLHVVLGGRSRRREALRVDDFMAYYRRVREAFEAAADTGTPVYPPTGTYPEPVEHCDVCRWAPGCRARRLEDDDLSRVAGATTRQRKALKARGIATRRSLAGLRLPLADRLDGVSPPALQRVREQARIQVESDDAGVVRYELLPLELGEDGQPVPGRGLLGLPVPSAGDLFLDLEGDPFALEEGVDYLFGILEPALPETDPRWATTAPPEAPVPRFHAIWSLDAEGRVTAAAEQAAFEQTIDLIMDRWSADPAMHVYHYAAYERTAISRLAQRYGTRELEVDRLLRGEVLVDLFRAVRQGLRAGVESYSIKRLEPLYSLQREVGLKDAGSSIVAFESWLELGPDEAVEDGPRILADIEGYNRDDVVSNWRLRDWLEERRAELETREGRPLARPGADDGAPRAELDERERRVAALMEELTGNVPPDPEERRQDADAQGRWLLAQLLAWHRREDKAAWWRYYELLKLTDEELRDEKEPLAGLVPVDGPRPDKSSQVWTFAFPEQDHKIDLETEVRDPRTGDSAGTVVGLDETRRRLELRRGPSLAGTPLPTALIPLERVPVEQLAASLLRTGDWVARHGLADPFFVPPGEPDRAAVRALLLRSRPVDRPGPVVQPGERPLDTAIRLATRLDGRVLPIQGPPGSGKTYTGAQMIVQLVQEGRRVGVVANSHKVVGNLLATVDEAARAWAAAGRLTRPVRIGQKPKNGQPPTFPGARPLPGNAEVAQSLRAGELDVVGAVAWTWCRPEMAAPDPVVDVLVVDEAGQLSLANAVASAPAARGLVLLGDPQQLDQPTQGSHPPGAERSVLGHLLGDRATIADDEGLFLEETWRLHPAICRYTSEAFYDGRLRPVAGLERQAVDGGGPLAGSGLRFRPVVHTGNTTDSDEEADAIAALVADLLDGGPRWTRADGSVQPIGLDDIVIVAPYNAHVAAIERAFERARLGVPFVGTVDRFQGQERPISIYAMGTSTPEDAPRGMEFLYSLNRLNVATSRARCAAMLVASPALLDVACRTPRQMRLANGLCLAVEMASDPVSSPR